MNPYVIGGAAIGLAIMTGSIVVQTSRLNACKAEFETFKLQVKTLGDEAKRRADAKEATDKLNKEMTDAQTAKLSADLNAATQRLRDNARSSFVPSRASPSGSPDVQCYDRTGLDGALRAFAEGAAGLIGEGSKNSLDLRLAREWAQH